MREEKMRTVALIIFGVFAQGTGAVARADVWDTEVLNDDSWATHNELVHGSNQLHDLAARPGPLADQDWFTISSKPWASYEVTIDATSGDIGAPVVELRTSDGATLISSAVPVGNGFSYSLRWQNDTSAAVSHRVKVMSGACSTNCGADDVYHIRAYESSYGIARFNNTGSQVTVLQVQNSATYNISGTVYFWADTGTQIASYPFTLGPKALLTYTTSASTGATAGSMTVSSTGRYGDLTGKAASMDAGTGFAFDSPMVPRPN
jgi:hypothetical protein